MYQTLYRKYRPNNLNEVVGQNIIIQTLKNSILNNKITHAYLFTGPRGTGKTSVAKILARTINCTNLNDLIPCDNCSSCIQNLNQPIDIIEIDAASNNGVDEIRELKNKVNLVPAVNKYKVYIIDEVHMLTTGAFNALLKTLEEPPSHIVFILATTEPHKIPTTILSRCQRFDFKRINNKDIIERIKKICEIEKIKIDDICLNEIAHLSNGGMRDALSILDQVVAYSNNNITIDNIHEINGTITPIEIKKFIDNINNKNLDKLLEIIDIYDEKGKDFIKLSEEILVYLRNLLFKISVPKYFQNMNINKEDYNLDNINVDDIVNYIEYFNNIISIMKNTNNPKLIFELNIIKIINKYENNLKNKEKRQEKNEKIKNKKVDKLEKKEYNNEIIQQLQEIRINNTLCNFNKKELIELNKKMEQLNQLVIDPEYSEYASIVLDGTLKAVGGKNIIFVYNNEHDSKLYNENLEKIDEMFKFIFNCEYKSIATNMKHWDKIKKEFNNKEKIYEYKEEPKNILKKINKTMENNIETVFGNILEYK